MASTRALRLCMLGLVLLNLVFVQMTGAASTHRLVPLFALALAAPLLQRFRASFVYRFLWNVGVVAFFVRLLQHAATANLAYVLEDGLILAVFCQVHLLNNLGDRQRPDLLFYNAFLIAIIAGFVTRDLSFAWAFLVFAPFFLVGQALLNLAREGHELDAAGTRAVVRAGLVQTAGLLFASLLAFLFWPRDFDRKPFFKGTFEMVTGGPELELGFNERLDLSRRGRVADSDEEALRITLVSGSAEDVPTLWRGATLGQTTGTTWHPVPPAKRRLTRSLDRRWRGVPGHVARTSEPLEDPVELRVVRRALETERLFTPLESAELKLLGEHSGKLLRPRHDGTLDVSEAAEVTYELSLPSPSEDGPDRGGPVPDELDEAFAPFLQLPESDQIELALSQAADLARQLPDGAEQHELVERMRTHLARRHPYVPPGGEGAADSLHAFLRGEGGGHCEFFASALALMLRSQGVPARVVTGYLADDWNADRTVLRVSSKDAHAWVEAYDPEGGWYAVDATPAFVQAEQQESDWQQWMAGARSLWESVTDFDDERRAAFVAWGRRIPGRVVDLARRRPVESVLAVLALAGFVRAWLLFRARRTDRAVRDYARALRAARLRALPGETPRELLARARTTVDDEDKLRTLERATRSHEAARYAA